MLHSIGVLQKFMWGEKKEKLLSYEDDAFQSLSKAIHEESPQGRVRAFQPLIRSR